MPRTPDATPSSSTTLIRCRSHGLWAALVGVLGCAGCNGDDLALRPVAPWTRATPVHRAVSDGVAVGAVIIDRVQFPAPASGDGTQEPAVARAAWVELINPGNQTVRMAGFGLSDQRTQPFKWLFPADTVLVAGGRLRVWMDIASTGTPDAVRTVLVTAPDGTPAGLLLDSTQTLRRSAQVAWCRQSWAQTGARFGPCAAATALSTRGQVQDRVAAPPSLPHPVPSPVDGPD